jgi:hypothetical protein
VVGAATAGSSAGGDLLPDGGRDPSAVPEEFPTEETQENERLRLFTLISELVTWENTTNEQVLERARAEIRRSWRRACADNADHLEAAELFNPEKLPDFHDRSAPSLSTDGLESAQNLVTAVVLGVLMGHEHT